MSKKSTKLKAFQETLKENNITLASIEKNDGLIRITKKNAEQSGITGIRPMSGIFWATLSCSPFLQCLQTPMNEARLKHSESRKKNGISP